MPTDYYNQHSMAFVEGTLHLDMGELHAAFLELVPLGGRVLDAGCGSGRDAMAFLEAGLQVDAFDASPRMARMASELTGIDVQTLRFQEFSASRVFDGIWACASLLHVPAAELPDTIARLAAALRGGGVLYASFKEGEGEREEKGRCFTDLSLPGLEDLVEGAGLRVHRSWPSNDLRPGREHQAWVNVLAVLGGEGRRS